MIYFVEETVYLFFEFLNFCRWGILHTEKFWKENAKFVEADNFSLLKSLILLAQSSDEVLSSGILRYLILFFSFDKSFQYRP